MNRRRFLKGSGALIAQHTLKPLPIALLLDSILQGLFSRAVAEQTGQTTKNWVDFCFFGAPPNWHYDLFLKTRASDELIDNAMVTNCFEERLVGKKKVFTPVYKTWDYKGIPAPYIWQFDVPAPGGGTRKMAELLDNFLSIRGIYTALNDHAPNMIAHFQTPGAKQSLPAYIADASSASISAVRLNMMAAQFISLTNKLSLDISARYENNESPVTSLATAFRSAIGSNATYPTNVATAIDKARNALAKEARLRHPKNQLAQESMETASKLIKNIDWSRVETSWTTLLNKYSQLVSRSFDFESTKLKGISDKFNPYNHSLANSSHQLYWEGDLLTSRDDNKDLRTLLLKGPTPTVIEDPKTKKKEKAMVVKPASVYGLAEGFALAELILTYNLSNSITVGLGSPNTPVGLVGIDQHRTGAVPGIILNSHTAIAHAACLLEFISFLKNPDKDGKTNDSLWNNTLINASGEMIRSPLNNAVGSGHSSTAYFTLYSGCIEGPIVLGDIAKQNGPFTNGNLKDLPGTWGETADKTFTMEYAHNTVAAILGLKQPLPRNASLVTLNNGVVKRKDYTLGKIK